MLATETLRLEKGRLEEHATRNGLICAFVFAACLWATYPVAEIGINDDWSFIKTAQVFSQTGHFVYNGWSAMPLGWLVLWGALFIKLFGFSFTVLRLSILPIAMATTWLFHAVLVRFGISSRDAVLGTLTLGLSPLFMPLALTYMSDIPGLFVIVLCLYLCQRAVAASSSKSTIGWLCLAAATNVLGGSVRQIVWLGALVMVPSTGWMLRRRRGVLLTSLLLWVISAVSIFACLRWYARQPYALPEPILEGHPFDAVPAHEALHLCLMIIGSVLCLLLVIFPILIAWLPKARRLSYVALLRIAGIILAWGVFQGITKWTMPWLYLIINTQFAAVKTGQGLPVEPISLPMWAREAISLLVIAAALVFVEYLFQNGRTSGLKDKAAEITCWQKICWLLGPFTLSYFVMLMPRAYHEILVDRYLLPIMPIAIICLLRVHQQWITPSLPTLSLVTLALFSLLAIGGTHDWFAWERARLAAIDEIRASGVPRTAIQGGFEYDGWTQIDGGGYINDSRLKVPAGAYHPAPPSKTPKECRLDFAPYTPAIHPKFTVAFPKVWCLEPSKYPPVSYSTWLPPYKGIVYVQKIPDGFN